MVVNIDDNNSDWLRARVTLDGIVQSYCLYADNTLNYVRRYKIKFERGEKLVARNENGDPIVETAFGRVWIEFP